MAKSWNSVTGPSSSMLRWASCCHFAALLWKPANEAFPRRADCNGILRALEVLGKGVRSVLVEMEARFLARVAGHLLTAPNMMCG